MAQSRPLGLGDTLQQHIIGSLAAGAVEADVDNRASKGAVSFALDVGVPRRKCVHTCTIPTCNMPCCAVPCRTWAYPHAMPPCHAPMPCPHAIHPCHAPMPCTHAMPCLTHMPCTHAMPPYHAMPCHAHMLLPPCRTHLRLVMRAPPTATPGRARQHTLPPA